MAYVTSCRTFHAASGMGLGLGAKAYQAIFPPFLVPMKVRCIAISMCLIPSHGPTPTISVKTLAEKSNSRIIGEVHKNKMSFDLRQFRVKNVNFAVTYKGHQNCSKHLSTQRFLVIVLCNRNSKLISLAWNLLEVKFNKQAGYRLHKSTVPSSVDLELLYQISDT